MEKNLKKTILLIGVLIIAASAALLVSQTGFSLQKNVNKEIAQYENKDIINLITAYGDNGEKIDPRTIDESLYKGYMFRLKDNAPESYRNEQIEKQSGGEIVYYPTSNTYAAASLETIDDFIEEKYISYIEPDYLVQAADVDMDMADAVSNGVSAEANVPNPDDEKYSSHQWNLEMMNVKDAWKENLYGQYIDKKNIGSVKVAVVDSGLYGTGGTQTTPHEDIDYSHVKHGVNLVDTAEGTPDTLGHGTFVSGLIFAQMNNSKGIAGIMPEVNIVPIRIFGSSGEATTSVVVEGIYDAIDADADVINLSLGSAGDSATMKEACETAVAEGILVVAAAGNDGTSVNNYPADYDCVVGVASLDSDGGTSYFSQYGASVYVAAPGGAVTSTYNGGSQSYKTGSGTSYACPEVVALGAMARSVIPEMDQSRFMELLRETSQDKGTEGFDKYYGWGLVDFGSASRYLLDMAYVPIYHVSLDITDKDDNKVEDVDIQIEAAENITWEDDADLGIEAGSWEKGHTVKPKKNGTYSLHKGKYLYKLKKDGYYPAQGSFTTYSENQTVSAVIEKAYDVEINITDSENDKIDDGEVIVKRKTDGLTHTVTQSENGGYKCELPDGMYEYSTNADGYETVKGTFVVRKQRMTEDITMHTQGQLCTVSFRYETNTVGDGGESGEVLTGASVTVKDRSDREILPEEEGIYKLVRGQRYVYVASKVGYDDETGKITIKNRDSHNVVISMTPTVYYAVVHGVDDEGFIMENADVEIKDSDNNITAPTKTDKNKFNLNKGEYSYTVNCDGYGTEEGSFEVKSPYRELKIMLEPAQQKVNFNIKDAEGTKLDGAVISVYDVKGNVKPAKESGNYLLGMGDYSCTVFLEGYEALNCQFEVAQKESTVDVTMNEQEVLPEAFSGGSGTQADPYLISNEAQMNMISEKTKLVFAKDEEASTNRKYELDECYKLVCDIELTGESEPIGNYESESNYAIFTGSFDGAGHTIRGVNINREGTICNGFFGAVESADIKNLSIEGSLKSGAYTGGLIGCILYSSAEKSLVENCSFTGKVRGTRIVGGLVGYVSADTSAKINVYIDRSSHSGGFVKAVGADGAYGDDNTVAGGILGEGRAVRLTSCSNQGDVWSQYTAGGIAGSMKSNTYLYNAYNAGNITEVGETVSKKFSGGIIGNLYGNIDTCFYKKNESVNAGIGTIQPGASSANIERMTEANMKNNPEFVDALNIKQNTAGDDYCVSESYPLLAWQTAAKEKIYAEKPEIEEISGDCEYSINSLETEPVRAKVKNASDGGVLTYQWYRNDIKSLSMAEAVAGASGEVGANGITEMAADVAKTGESYYFVRITNEVTVNGKTAKNSVYSDFVSVSVKSEITAQEPIIEKAWMSGPEDLKAVFNKGAVVDERLCVSARTDDNGILTYQWYVSQYADTKGKPIKGGTDEECNIDTSSDGVYYYYAAVSNAIEGDDGSIDVKTVKSGRITVTILDIDKVNAYSVKTIIDGIGEVSLKSENLIIEARASYEALSDSGKLFVDNIAILEAAESRLKELKVAAEEAGRTAGTPTAVTGAKAVRVSCNSVKISWAKAGRAKGYEIYRATSKNGTYARIKTITSGSSVAYTNSGLRTGTRYYYKVRAYNTYNCLYSNRTETLFGSYSVAVSAKPYLTKPTVKLKAGYKRITVSWGKVSGASGYKIYRSIKKSSGYKCVKTISKGSTLKYINKSLKRGKTYYYKVYAYRSVNGKLVYSSPSEIKYKRAK